MPVELVYDEGCPNVVDARAELLRAFAEAGMPPRWQEWRTTDADAPARVRGYGSPTVLVDGTDVAGAQPGPELQSCRLYAGPDGPHGAPPFEAIVAALVRSAPGAAGGAPPKRAGWKGALSMAPGDRCVASPERGLPRLLAGLRGCLVQPWPRLLARDDRAPAADRSVFGHRGRGARVSGAPAARL